MNSHTFSKHRNYRKQRFKRNAFEIDDYIDLNLTLHYSIKGRSYKPPDYVIVELLVVTDFELTTKFQKNYKSIANYIAVFIRTINLRYGQIENPRIIFRVW